jgi:capsular polysaccharide biosynthesis protein
MDILTQTPGKRLLRSKKLIIAIAVLTAIFTGGTTLLFPLQYRADAEIYILSQARFGVDPYTVARSGERIAENLAEVMRTDDFYEKAKTDTAYKVDWSYFEDRDARTRKKLWEKTINPSVVYGTSILTISAFHASPAEAHAIAGAVANTAVTKTTEYVGGDVSIRLVSRPVVTRVPVRPNPLVNAGLGALAGALVAAIVVLKK